MQTFTTKRQKKPQGETNGEYRYISGLLTTFATV